MATADERFFPSLHCVIDQLGKKEEREMLGWEGYLLDLHNQIIQKTLNLQNCKQNSGKDGQNSAKERHQEC